MKRTTAIVLGLTMILTAAAAIAQMTPSGPAPELKKLDFMSGDWTAEGTTNSPGSAPGKFTQTSHAEWLEGNYFLVAHNEGDYGAMGKAKELAVMGYDPHRKVYTYHAFSSVGEAGDSTGTVDGDTWIWTSNEQMGGTTMKGRYTMKVLSPTSYTMKYELSQDGTSWITAMEGKATKK